MVALMMVVFLGVAAMAIDYGIWFTDRSEAQRAAEASAHAGASILMLSPADEAGARAEAELFAERNTVRNEVHDVFPDQDIDVLVDEQKMRVRVQRSAARGNPLAIDNGAKPVPITGFGGMFLDHWDGGNEVWVRFHALPERIAATDPDFGSGSLLRVLRIVE